MPTPPLPLPTRTVAARVALTYGGVAALWILLSDRALDLVVTDPRWHLRLSVAKGWAFVTVTALLLYGYLKVRADDRLALLEAARQARVVPWRCSLEGEWEFEASSRDVLGLDPAALTRVGALERSFEPEDLHRFATARQRARRGTLETFDARFRRADGRTTWTRWTLRGTPGGLQGVVQDVAELYAVQTELLQHQRRELVARLAGGVTHDLKNLLQAILGATELLQLTPRLESEARSLTTILKASQRARDLLQQMLGLVRSPEARPGTSGDLVSVMVEAADLLRHALPQGILLDLQIPEDPLPCRFDDGQILQVLMNLGLNARDAVGTSGTVRLRAGGDLGPAGEPLAWVEVSDTGPGIPPEALGRLFEPFYTTKDAGVGTGLGLPTAKAIAEAHGGRLECRSAPGEGARFRLTLPASGAGAPGGRE
jgi:signal transduction histidine kinase